MIFFLGGVLCVCSSIRQRHMAFCSLFKSPCNVNTIYKPAESPSLKDAVVTSRQRIDSLLCKSTLLQVEGPFFFSLEKCSCFHLTLNTNCSSLRFSVTPFIHHPCASHPWIWNELLKKSASYQIDLIIANNNIKRIFVCFNKYLENTTFVKFSGMEIFTSEYFCRTQEGRPTPRF